MPDVGAIYLEEARRSLPGHKRLAEAAMAQLSDEQFFALPDAESNSVAIIVKHMAGNMRSRWTDFLTSDGEKPDRDRDSEFVVQGADSRAHVLALTSDGDQPAAVARLLQDTYTRCINKALEAKPADMVITTHLCRGNFRSTFVSSGGYQPVADKLFNDLAVDGYFLEWDTERAGGLEPLRALPKGNKIVVLGLITSKSGKLEDKGAIERRIEEASKYAPLDQLCLSPQCGFASTEDGNTLSIEEQWAKLARVVEIAKEVWG